MSTTTYVLIDPKTGAHTGVATDAQRDAYLAQPARFPSERRPVRVGEVLVDEWQGYGSPDNGWGA